MKSRNTTTRRIQAISRYGLCVALLSLTGLAEARILNVPDDYYTIRGAIGAAEPHDTVLVQEGVYRGGIDFDGREIVVGSTFLLSGDRETIARTVIDADFSGHAVTISSGEGRGAVLCGFTIRNGRVHTGGGVYCRGTEPRLDHLVIADNHALEDGGGIACMHGASPFITDCELHDNSADGQGGGIYCREYSNPRITHVVIRDNSASSGGGIFCNNDSRPVIDNTDVIGNEADSFAGGIALLPGCNAQLYRVAVVGNRSGALYAGGVYIGAANPVLNHLTIAANRTDGRGGGFYFLGSARPIIANSIIWGNDPDEGYARGNPEPAAYISVSYTDIDGGYDGIVIPGNARLNWGRGNIDADPRFADIDQHDAHLTQDSPCIDTGDPSSAPDPDGSRVDMGAYYYSGSSVTDPPDYRNITGSSFRIIAAYPNPFNSAVTLNFHMPRSGMVNLTVYDLGGGRVHLQRLSGSPGYNRITLDASRWPVGPYIARLQAGAETLNLRLTNVK